MSVDNDLKQLVGIHGTYIGKPLPRPNAPRLAQGAARYTPDITLPGMLHVVFIRSPYAHARIRGFNAAAALQAPGVAAVVTGRELAAIAKPMVARLEHLPGLKAPPQYPMAVEVARHQGEAVAAVLAFSRAQAEDAADLVEIDWQELPAIVDPAAALLPDAPVLHAELGDNLAFSAKVDKGDVDAAFAQAKLTLRRDFSFSRHTGVPLEPRAILAQYDAIERRLLVTQSTQTPYQNQAAIAAIYGLRESDIQVEAPDVGGSFGVKLHTYADEMAVCGLALLLKRPVKFVSDRLESFVSDIQARGQDVSAGIAVAEDGRVLAYDVDALSGIGPYSVYPRTSTLEGIQVMSLTGSCYNMDAYRARLRLAFQNKPPMGAYRAVGHPIVVALSELLLDSAARRLGIDPVDIRRRNLLRDEQYPFTTLSGMVFERLSHHQCLDKLVQMMDYDALRRDQAECRARGIYRGIGLAAVVELTNPGPAAYSPGQVRISAQDGCQIRLQPDGRIHCAISITEQGQGNIAAITQVVADVLGVRPADIRVEMGSTATTPYGGGTYGSRGAGVGGEAALRAAGKLRASLLRIAGALLQAAPESLELRDGMVSTAGGTARIDLAEIGRIAYFRPDTLPRDLQPDLSASGHFTQLSNTFVFTNGFQASYLEVDVESGFVKLLKHWAVEDCGRIINPLLVDEQMRGGIVQGIGGALYEACLYDENGQMLNGSLVDYLVPMAAELPDIEIGHVETPTLTSLLGAKGAGEAGTAGAPAAVLNAINDALSGFDVEIFSMPATPEMILRALGRLPRE
ncbi:xanthine dehydrogenase family protein molybdopterin-binding subunit [Ferrovibrio sp.]|uniref:xanthine dehydrogenase family protein molybdopterin-binding subunit n=1 Tax=Ferrovibrio sp. TaxID=1917215 RepID=UPI001B52987B|nr:xanthine dehydrogenase family protein molybdopterin-binding subunit [Ferrovibrio sp.]MBP7065015.1 xanthine dehydrogenase family protein [Ferrovibrio sp.]